MHLSSHNISSEEGTIERLAQRRAGQKLGWFIHASVYLIVNLGLMALSFSHDKHWAIYPAFFWGIGLLAHGASVWLRPRRSAIWTRMVQREHDMLLREKQQHQQDTHSVR